MIREGIWGGGEGSCGGEGQHVRVRLGVGDEEELDILFFLSQFGRTRALGSGLTWFNQRVQR